MYSNSSFGWWCKSNEDASMNIQAMNHLHSECQAEHDTLRAAVDVMVESGDLHVEHEDTEVQALRYIYSHTFTATDPRSRMLLPPYGYAFLSHKAAVDVSIIDNMRKLNERCDTYSRYIVRSALTPPATRRRLFLPLTICSRVLLRRSRDPSRALRLVPSGAHVRTVTVHRHSAVAIITTRTQRVFEW